MNTNNNSSRQIVSLGEDGMLGIPQYLIPVFLHKYDLNKSLPKKVHELLVGYILVQFLGEKQRESAMIGFPAAEGWRKRCPDDPLTLDRLLENHKKLIKDTDVDIRVSSSGLTTKYQITRFVYPTGRTAHRKLAELIAKKCRHQQPDPSLNLLVSVEKTPNISENELRNLVTKTNIPFGGILLIMKASSEKGHFSFCQLYPKLIPGKEVWVPLPV
ncbi:MAG: hypothetical protein KAU35_06825 [candidate division Zixibacteria bacterium]|nr:hypothetical protein [candidate division Zixibacteria bacterium]